MTMTIICGAKTIKTVTHHRHERRIVTWKINYLKLGKRKRTVLISIYLYLIYYMWANIIMFIIEYYYSYLDVD